MKDITANAPHPGSRTEAWVAWEAAVLEMQGISTVKRVSKHAKKFWKDFDDWYGWWLYAIDARPNRSEVLVEKIDGQKVWVDVRIGALHHKDKKEKYNKYLINPSFEPERNRQLFLLGMYGHINSLREIVENSDDVLEGIERVTSMNITHSTHHATGVYTDACNVYWLGGTPDVKKILAIKFAYYKNNKLFVGDSIRRVRQNIVDDDGFNLFVGPSPWM